MLKEGEIKLLVSGDEGEYFMVRVFKNVMVFRTQGVLIVAWIHSGRSSFLYLQR